MESIRLDETTRSLQIDDSSRVAEARREASRLATLLRFDQTDAGRVAIVATELATNLLKHAGRGELLLAAGLTADIPTIDLMTLDSGIGIVNIEASMRDGFSTAGSPGTGLGAIARMASYYAIYSYPNGGSIVHARIIAEQTSRSKGISPFDLYGINVPHPHEEISGDGWTSRISGERCLLIVVDGLGHGPSAAEAAQEALNTFRQTTSTSPAHIIEDIHGALRGTRGAVAAIAEVDLQRGEVSYAGIGNISAAVVMDSGVKRMVSHNGTLGSNMRKVMDMPYPFPHGSLLVMHSDGIGTHWSIDSYPGLISQGPGVIAGALYRDNNRRRDDATVVVLQERENESG